MSTKLNDRCLEVKWPNICVIFPGALGDFICFLPALRALASHHAVVLYSRSEYAEIVPGNVTVRSIERSEIGRLFVTSPMIDPQVRQAFEAFATVYSWMGHQQPAFVGQLQAATDGRARVYPFRPIGGVEHQTDYYLRCLGLTEVYESSIEFDSATCRWCDSFWQENVLCDRAVLTIAPGSGAREKNWPEEFFIEVADWWRQSTQGTALLLIGPVEADRGGFDRLREHCLTVERLGLAQVAALLKRSTVYLGNDSGVSHLAAAVGAVTVTLFGPSNVQQWAPRGRRVNVICRHIACSPCSVSVMKSCAHHRCLRDLTADRVIGVMRHLLELASLTRGGVGITV